MNLGETNLRNVNTSRPQLIHSNSKQSISASDDYYSLASEGSSNDDRTTVLRYDSPTVEAAHTSNAGNQSEATIPIIKPIKKDGQTPQVISQHQSQAQAQRSIEPHNQHVLHSRADSTTLPQERPLSLDTGFQHVRRQDGSTASSEHTIVRRPMSEVNTPTPGIDDTPYIQFAIEQLTRDEEVAGPRRQSESVGPAHPVERLLPNQYTDKSLPDTPLPPPIPPPEERRYQPQPEEVLLPVVPPTETHQHPRLRFVPVPLRPIPLSLLLLSILLMLAALAFCGAYPLHHSGLYDYDGTGTRRYFIFQYLPQILAAFILIWLFVIQSTIHRIYPFVALASGSSSNNSGLLFDVQLFPTNYLMPNFTYLRHSGPWLAFWTITSWLSIFTIPLQSCLFQTRYYPSEDKWRWTSVIPIAWVLFAIYFLLALSVCALLMRFIGGETGLKWDPTSIADIMAIFHRSNMLPDFDRSEVESALTRPPKDVRLGYWRNSRHEDEAFYCIGDENAPVRRYSLERGKMRPVTDQMSMDVESQRPIQVQNDKFRGEIHNPQLRYRWVTWFLRESFVVAWIVVAVVLLIAFLIASFVNNAVQRGFLPLLPTPTTPQSFSPSDFLYSFLPSFLGMILVLVWQPIDNYFRALQPYASLASPDGTYATRSLLLEYNSCLPIEITIRALSNGHYKVAYISAMGLLSFAIPILAGGIFTSQFVPGSQTILTISSMPGFIALVVFVIIYALSFPIIFPTRSRHLPHNISTLAETVSFFYQSPLIAEHAFSEPRNKTDLVTRLLTRPNDDEEHADNEAAPAGKISRKFAFGIHVGLDGREHLGIDRLERPGSGVMGLLL